MRVVDGKRQSAKEVDSVDSLRFERDFVVGLRQLALVGHPGQLILPMGYSLTGVTYGGQPMTHVVSDEEIFNFITSRIEIWVLDAAGIAAASGTVVA